MQIISENEHQKALRLWITKGLKIPEVSQLNGDAGYLFNNMIAKYTLFSDFYRISKAALRRLKKERVDLDCAHTRRKFYGRAKPYMYEHSIPATIIRNELLRSDKTIASVKRILKEAGTVVLILRKENEILRSSKLGNRMPPGWKLGDDPDARYRFSGIDISQNLLKVCGAICR